MRCSECGAKSAAIVVGSVRALRATGKVTHDAGSEASALNCGSLSRASRSFLHVLHELLESSARLSGGHRLGRHAGIVNALRYRRSLVWLAPRLANGGGIRASLTYRRSLVWLASRLANGGGIRASLTYRRSPVWLASRLANGGGIRASLTYRRSPVWLASRLANGGGIRASPKPVTQDGCWGNARLHRLRDRPLELVKSRPKVGDVPTKLTQAVEPPERVGSPICCDRYDKAAGRYKQAATRNPDRQGGVAH